MNVLVIGKAKTGTTVISKTIQGSIEGETEYYLEPKRISFFEQNKFINNEKSNIVKIIFEHWHATPLMRNAICHNEAVLKFDKIIYIIRDYRDELISRFMFILRPRSKSKPITEKQLNAWLNILRQKEKNPEGLSFIKMTDNMKEIFNMNFMEKIKKDIKLNDEYFNFIKLNCKIMHLVKYEDFISGNVGVLENYLGLKLTDNRDVGELLHTRRSTSYNNWKTFFTEEDVNYFKDLIGKNLALQGYDDWQLEKCESLDPDHFSNYVKRIANVK